MALTGRLGLLFAVLMTAFLWVPALPSAAAADAGLRRFGAQVDINDSTLAGLIAGGADVKVKGRSSGTGRLTSQYLIRATFRDGLCL